MLNGIGFDFFFQVKSGLQYTSATVHKILACSSQVSFTFKPVDKKNKVNEWIATDILMMGVI